jgi:YfiH family protein
VLFGARLKAPRNRVRVHCPALPILRVPRWDLIPQLTHGFCGRRGGLSRGGFAALNLSSRVGDEPRCVRENWRRLGAAVPGVRFVTMQQQHGAEVASVNESGLQRPAADALVTRSAGLALCILTADCVPILLVAPERRVIAAVHAGWRGTLLGIAHRAVMEMRDRFAVKASEVSAALGPAIGGCCYEVERRITDELEQRWGAMPSAITPRGAKSQLDLRRANTAILVAAGVPAPHIACIGPCTRCAAAEYFSYRGTGGSTGRQVSFIGWWA